ncbi:MAG: hypothetical protein KDA93_10775 [Planctomycetaceae bacterium]|nr:hypothetical protein [Planctomycetaceae bacterium]
MAKAKVIEDPDFGELRHETANVWVRDFEIFHLGKKWNVELYVSISDSGVEEDQRHAIQEFKSNTPELLAIAEREIRKYAGEYGISDSKFTENVHPTAIGFPYAQWKPTLGILYDVSWDESHGAAVRFEDGQFVEVGTQGVIL